MEAAEYKEKEDRMVELVQTYFKDTGFWEKVPGEQTQVMREFSMGVDEIWRTGHTLVADFNNTEMAQATGGGAYNSMINAIGMFKPSLMTMLHEIAHMLMHKAILDKNNPQHISIYWSHTIYKRALPELYKTELNKGLFFHDPFNERAISPEAA